MIQTERGYRFFRLRGKGNAERIVVIRNPVWKAIQYYARMNRKDLNSDQPLFTPVRNNRSEKVNKPVDSSLIFYIVRKYARLAGIAHKVSPHSCRATAISNARDHNVPDRAIQEFAGWSTTTMITRYDKRKSSLEKSAVHSIDYGELENRVPFIDSSS
jgi:integrase